MNKKNTYISDSFMYRAPNYPIENLQKIFQLKTEKLGKKEVIKFLLEDDFFYKSIKIASPSLLNSIVNIDAKKEKDVKNIYFAVLKYFIRLVSRPTPFGTFSSIGTGVFKEKSDIQFNQQKKKEKINISFEWINGLINLLISNNNYFEKTKVLKNELIIEKNEKIYLSFFSGISTEQREFEELTLNRSNLLNFILKLSEKEIEIREIVYYIQKNNTDIQSDKIIGYIRELVKKDILLTDLKMSNSIPKIQSVLLKSINSFLNEDDILKIQVNQIFEFIEQLNLKKTVSIEELTYLESLMGDLYKTEEYLHIDSIQESFINLNSDLKNEIEDYAKVMTILSQQTYVEDNALSFYLKKFIDSYGIYNAISVKDLIDTEKELGPPPTFSKPYGRLEYEFSNLSNTPKTSDLVKKMFYDGLSQNLSVKVEDYISDDDLSEVNYAESYDLYLSIYENTISKEKKIFSSGNMISPIAGRTFGRFISAFENEKNQLLNDIMSAQKVIEDQVPQISLSIVPLKPKAMNVMNVENKYEYELAISTKNNNEKKAISIDDVYIYSDGDNFYFYSKKLKSNIEFKFSNMVNHHFSMPNIYRFLIDLSLYKKTAIRSFDWGEMESYKVLPEVTYKNFVIRPRTWNLFLDKKSSDPEIYIDTFINQNKVPRFVKCVEFDNFILIDLNSKIMKDLLIFEFKKKKSLTLIAADEFNDEYTSLIRDSSNKNYINEFIFMGQNKKNNSVNQKQNNIEVTFHTKKEQDKFDDEEWLYFKIYNALKKDDFVIEQYLYKLFEKHPGFYIRYNDPYPHLRVRLKINNNYPELVDLVNKMFKMLNKQSISLNLVFDQYVQEVQRYGGSSLINSAEEFFCKNSMDIIKIFLDNPTIKTDRTLRINLAFLSVIKLTENNFNDFINHEWFENNFSIDKKFYSEYRENFKNVNSNELSTDYFLNMEHSYFYNLREIKAESTFYFNQIVSSIIHMHFNRFGIHGEEESKCINFVYFYMKEKFYKEKKTKKPMLNA